MHKGRVSFRVWAPFAQDVSVCGTFSNWSPVPMKNEGDGYWFTEVEGALPGQEYKYKIWTGSQDLYRNDPRALHVTVSGGNSVIVDTDFNWEGADYQAVPLNERVIYEMHIGTFYREDPSESGTFESAIKKLDYLAELGINTIELLPVATMAVDHSWWGYVSDYIYAVENRYGGRHAFLTFVKAAHERGISVILDVVYNHLDNDYSLDLWQFDGWSQDGKGGIYFYNDWRSATPWGETRFDYGRSEVRQYILDNVRLWLQECRADGLRLDATGFIRTVYGRHDDPSNDIPEGWSLLQDINRLAGKINPDALIIAEDFAGNDYITKPITEGGAGFRAQWEVNLPYIMRCTLDPMDDAVRNLGQTISALSRTYNGDVFQRVIYSESHDSVANGGARINEEISPGNPHSLYARRRLLLASALVLTAPGVPMLFQGQEFMEGGSFNDWKALDWEKAGKFEGITLAHKDLIALRQNRRGITRGLMGQSFAILHLNEEAKIIAYHRWDQGGPGDDVVVVFNLANRMQRDYFIQFPRSGRWEVRFNSDWKGYSPDFKDTQITGVHVEGDGASIVIAPYSVLIFSQG